MMKSYPHEEVVWQVRPEWTGRGGLWGGKSSEYRIKLCFRTPKPRKSAMLMGFQKKMIEIKNKRLFNCGHSSSDINCCPPETKRYMRITSLFPKIEKKNHQKHGDQQQHRYRTRNYTNLWTARTENSKTKWLQNPWWKLWSYMRHSPPEGLLKGKRLYLKAMTMVRLR